MAFAAVGDFYRNVSSRSRSNQAQWQSAFKDAVANRNYQEMVQAIQHGACWKSFCYNGETVLHDVLKKQCTEPQEQKKIIKILKYFIKPKKLKANVKCKDGKTALHLAVKHGMMEVIDFLIEKGANLKAVDGQGNSVLHYVIEGEFERYKQLAEKASSPDQLRPYYRESVRFLKHMLSKKIKVDCVNKNLETPLQMATIRNLLHLLPLLLHYSKNVTHCDEEKKTILHLFVKKKTDSRMVALKTCCYDKPLEIDILKMMLNKGYSVDATDLDENTPLHILALQHEPELMEIMLTKFTKLNACNDDGNTVLHLIIDYCIDNTLKQHEEERVKFVHYLISKGADIHLKNNQGFTPVQLAVMRLNAKILKILKDYGADLTEPYNQGNFLHLISTYSTKKMNSAAEETIRFLIDTGCDVNAHDEDGMTPMHLAVQFRKNAVIKGLAKCFADVNARELSERKFTPLQFAVHTNNIYSIDTLIKVGVDINVKDSTGKTALHLAMEYQNGLVEKFLRLGAHVEVEDDEKLLPLQYAIKYKNTPALVELLKYGADINDKETNHELLCLNEPGNIIRVLAEHWIKLNTIGLPTSPGYRINPYNEKFRKLYYDCMLEVEDLKVYEISDGISLYDLLHLDWNFRCVYTENKTFMDLIQSKVFQKKFPNYYVVILASYHESVARQSLLEPAKEAWCKLTKISLPGVCIYKILSFLNNRQLRIMVEGLKSGPP